MASSNNVNLDALEKSASTVRSDAAKARRTNRVEGKWNLQDGQPQFAAELSFEGGKMTLEADQPGFLGGGGTRPAPMMYALFGTASCFTASFVAVASQEGLKLEEVKTAVESDLDFSRVLGVADLPIVDEVRISLSVKSNASPDQLERVLRIAEEVCPASFCLRNPIKLTARLA